MHIDTIFYLHIKSILSMSSFIHYCCTHSILYYIYGNFIPLIVVSLTHFKRLLWELSRMSLLFFNEPALANVIEHDDERRWNKRVCLCIYIWASKTHLILTRLGVKYFVLYQLIITISATAWSLAGCRLICCVSTRPSIRAISHFRMCSLWTIRWSAHVWCLLLRLWWS